MFQSKEHLIRSSDPSLWGFAGLDLNDDDHNHYLSTRIWNALNSKLFNVLILLLVLIDTFIIISLILIDSNWIRDPEWRSVVNCTDNTNTTTVTEYDSKLDLSPNLLRIRHIFSYIPLTIISFFFIEVLLRIFSGKTKLFVEPFDLLDALLVNIVFILSLIFYFHTSNETKSGGKESTLLIIVLRLWRVFRIVESLIEESQQRIVQTLNVCEKEKTHCEHKIDILILKVEDLEHEVAYLKEKLKKSEKENCIYVQQLLEVRSKKNAKRTQSSQSYCPCRKDSFKMIDTPQMQTTFKLDKNCAQINSTLVDIETQPLVINSDIDGIDENVIDLDDFAKNLAQSITFDVMNAVIDKTNCHSFDSLNNCLSETSALTSKPNGMQSKSNKFKLSPSSDSRNSYKKLINNSVIKQSIFNDSDIYSGLYFISEPLNHSKPIQSKITSSLDSSSAAHQLNEDSDIERIRKVEFNINDRDIPLSSL